MRPFVAVIAYACPSSRTIVPNVAALPLATDILLIFTWIVIMLAQPTASSISPAGAVVSDGQRTAFPANAGARQDRVYSRKRPLEREAFSEEHRLQRHLLRPYDSAVRPLKNSSGVVTVNLTMTLTQISQVDERNQIVTMNVWLTQKWFDEHMTWDPAEFANITAFRIPAEKLWLPDIVLYNNADDYNKEPMKINVVVYSNGEIHWIPPMKLRVVCPIDTTFFPFDDQTCKLKLGSWIYDGDQLNIEKGDDKIVLDDYQENGEWNITNISIDRRVVRYNCCAETWPSIFFTFNLRRKTIYYSYNVIAPCIMLSALTIALFYLPSQSNEKVTLGLTVLLAYMVFMLMIRDRMPETSDSLPLLGVYIMTDMFLSAFSVAVAVGVLSCHYRGTNANRGPRWLRFIAFRVLEPLVTCCRTRHSYYKFDALMLSNRRRAAVSAAGGDTPTPEDHDNRRNTFSTVNGAVVEHTAGPPSTSLISLANIYGNEQLEEVDAGDGSVVRSGAKKRRFLHGCSHSRTDSNRKRPHNAADDDSSAFYEQQLLRRFAPSSPFSLPGIKLNATTPDDFDREHAVLHGPHQTYSDDELMDDPRPAHSRRCTAHRHHPVSGILQSASRAARSNHVHALHQQQQQAYDEYVLTNVRTIVDKMHLTTHKNIALDEWKQMAEIFDRFFFLVFLLGITAMTVGMLKVWPQFKASK